MKLNLKLVFWRWISFQWEFLLYSKIYERVSPNPGKVPETKFVLLRSDSTRFHTVGKYELRLSICSAVAISPVPRWLVQQDDDVIFATRTLEIA